MSNPSESDSSSQHAWLIECVTAHTPLWFDGSFERDGRNRIAKFVADANMAVRYPSRAAAEWAFESLLEMRPRSILGSDCYRITEHEWSGVRSERTSLSIPSGWKLVPIEPTAEMLAAGGAAVLPEPSRSDMELARKAAPMIQWSDPRYAGNLHVEAARMTDSRGGIQYYADTYEAMLAAAPQSPTTGDAQRMQAAWRWRARGEPPCPWLYGEKPPKHVSLNATKWEMEPLFREASSAAAHISEEMDVQFHNAYDLGDTAAMMRLWRAVAVVADFRRSLDEEHSWRPDGGVLRFESHPGGDQPHVHTTCSKCGARAWFLEFQWKLLSDGCAIEARPTAGECKR